MKGEKKNKSHLQRGIRDCEILILGAYIVHRSAMAGGGYDVLDEAACGF